MTKSLFEKLFLKKHLYKNEGRNTSSAALQYVKSDFGRPIGTEGETRRGRQSSLLLSFLPPTYDHLTRIIMYGKETSKLEDVKQML